MMHGQIHIKNVSSICIRVFRGVCNMQLLMLKSVVQY